MRSRTKRSATTRSASSSKTSPLMLRMRVLTADSASPHAQSDSEPANSACTPGSPVFLCSSSMSVMPPYADTTKIRR